jgi:hypothetical protein
MAMEQGQPQELPPQEGQPQGTPEDELKGALDGLMQASEAMTTVAEAFMQMGQKGPAMKLAQAGQMASQAIQELLGGGKPAGNPQSVQDPNAAGRGSAVPVG